RPAMNPIARFSPTSTGPAGFGAAIGRGVAIGLAVGTGVAGRVNTFGGAGGRLNGLMSGSSAISPSYEHRTVWLHDQSWPSFVSRDVAHLSPPPPSREVAWEAGTPAARRPRIHSRPQLEIRPDRCGLARRGVSIAAWNAGRRARRADSSRAAWRRAR